MRIRFPNAPAETIAAGWTFCSSPPDLYASPADIAADAEWLPALVPGTVAAALRALGLFDIDHPTPLEDKDFWYRTSIEGDGEETLRFLGLATIAQVFLDGVKLFDSTSMFVENEAEVDLNGRHELSICFRALGPLLEKPGKRARWRPRNVTPSTLRAFRTTFLGHAPGWCPPVHPIGPWRAIERRKGAWIDCDLNATLKDRDGHLRVDLTFDAPPAGDLFIECAGQRVSLTRGLDDAFSSNLIIPDVKPWWPHTHGEPALHDVFVIMNGERHAIARTGFRSIELDRDSDSKGFGLRINGVSVFCRGAVWTNADVVALPGSPEAYGPLLDLARDANMNMLRVGGTMVYESDAFYRMCDERGILVWQDFMFSNFDYPAGDDAFVELVHTEAKQFVARTKHNPCMAVFCGGSEVAQQAAMLGLPSASWSNRIFDDVLKSVVEEARPDAIYVAHTPHGGPMPFYMSEGLCHYYGVSAYFRPVEDARHANVRFATESLGHAHVPDAARIELEPDAPRIVHAQYTERVHNDSGATWWFEYIRNHYVRELYGIDPEESRRTDAEHFLDISRATTAELLESVYALWRRQGSPTRGGLVWFLRDLREEAGWGVIDGLNQPKAAYYALRRAFRPVQVLLIDEGLNGLDVHCINETAQEISAQLTLTCLRDGSVPVMRAARELQLAPRSIQKIPAVYLWGAFFDTSYAYRFGPPSHDVTVATLMTPRMSTDAFHFPLGRGAERHDLGLQAELVSDEQGWGLRVSTARLAQSFHVRDAQYRPDDNWFHLPPATTRVLRLVPRDASHSAKPRGYVAAVNGLGSTAYRDDA